MPTGPAPAYVTLRRSLEKPQGGLPQDDEPRQTSDKLVRLIYRASLTAAFGWFAFFIWVARLLCLATRRYSYAHRL